MRRQFRKSETLAPPPELMSGPPFDVTTQLRRITRYAPAPEFATALLVIMELATVEFVGAMPTPGAKMPPPLTWAAGSVRTRVDPFRIVNPLMTVRLVIHTQRIESGPFVVVGSHAP